MGKNVFVKAVMNITVKIADETLVEAGGPRRSQAPLIISPLIALNNFKKLIKANQTKNNYYKKRKVKILKSLSVMMAGVSVVL